MARIKIEDLPKDKKFSKEEMRKVMGGGIFLAPDIISPGTSDPFDPIDYYDFTYISGYEDHTTYDNRDSPLTVIGGDLLARQP